MRAFFFGTDVWAGAPATAALLVWAVLAIPLTPVRAADLDYAALRGAVMDDKPTKFGDWSGVYVGAQAGYANTNVDFGNAAGDLVAYALRDTIIEAEAAVSGWTVLPERDARRGVFGAFLGYNSQWDDVVLGVEVNYNYTDLSVSAQDKLRRSYVTSNQYTYDVGLDSRSAVKIVDYMTFRTRAGYVLGSFMPYASLGVAVGRASIDRSASVSTTAVDYSGARRPTLSLDPNPTTISETKNNEFAYGVAAGLGVDVLVTESIFLRGEYEYIRFVSLSKARADINALRGAVGVKF
ncbi:outer membrane protein [Chelatococcus asaccharovorans]|uniref:Opacity protein-like surface antigen n=1 Tax=Chelatococcus asaccharovorans TaxID=28210 RepID=A0A2V3U9B8_9HYPH|nr:outer membrane beta-barrel protein [Chelatococcus asaccharovorans]MBS7705298.1 porin family protein [Chelatococcus asaccharovorans]PXW60299.1 opacity protein-like surface antigen [Chelatococcus asaccharovorans]CAH1654587.1 Opacity protein-like surface antigen [Chelatococcus asaccharovorans]CAH1685703.1 Opacity protein-like surface antigen [Chelatococcus asaccharovorans]